MRARRVVGHVLRVLGFVLMVPGLLTWDAGDWILARSSRKESGR